MFQNIAKYFHHYAQTYAQQLFAATTMEHYTHVPLKSYPRLPQIPLTRDVLPLHSLTQALESRYSFRNFDVTQPLSERELATLLYYASGINPKRAHTEEKHHFVPSGGGLYPVETYVCIQRSGDIPPGLYHYSAEKHALAQLLKGEDVLRPQETLGYPWSQRAPCVVMFTATWDRSFAKYQDFGYPATLLETGHISQTVLLVAAAMGLVSCPLLGYSAPRLCEVLDIDGLEEAPIQLIALGKK